VAAGNALTKLTKDKSYLVTAAAARALGNYKTESTTKLLTNLLGKPSWSEVVRSGALSALAETGDETAVQTLIEWSAYGRPLRARRAAIAALPKLGEGKKVRDHLCDMLSDRDPHVRSAVLSALGTLGDEKSRSSIDALLAHELDGGVRTRAREILSELGRGGIQGIKEAKEENQRLKRDLADLELRLARLEQRLDRGRTDENGPGSPSAPKDKSRKKKVAKKASPSNANKKAPHRATAGKKKSARAKVGKKRTSRKS
jgi:HEAT repeat protein